MAPEDETTLGDLEGFAKSVAAACLTAFVPTASYPTRYMAAETLTAVLELWGHPAVSPTHEGPMFSIFPATMSWPALCWLLLTGVADPWGRLREACLRALVLLPAPLPGLEDEESVGVVVDWADRMLRSPRVKGEWNKASMVPRVKGEWNTASMVPSPSFLFFLFG